MTALCSRDEHIRASPAKMLLCLQKQQVIASESGMEQALGVEMHQYQKNPHMERSSLTISTMHAIPNSSCRNDSPFEDWQSPLRDQLQDEDGSSA